jgi:hypothetical protein
MQSSQEMKDQEPATLPYGDPRDPTLKTKREKPLVTKPIKHRGAVFLLSLTVAPVITATFAYIDSLMVVGQLPDYVFFLGMIAAAYLAFLSQRGQDLVLRIAAVILVTAISFFSSIFAAFLFMPDW